MTAQDLRYGRRGGGWVPDRPPAEMPDGYQPPARFDYAASVHPDAIARRRAHDRTPTCPARGKAGTVADCTCHPDPDDLNEVWAGRARMAAARGDAGQPLDDIDRQALRRTA